ncbi:type I-U CRISPR-associated helicase/endonuclease Cas3 (plasmid) [Cereibacter azotoformans]|uniref:CRISPR-associated endonuclease/helicase Cas3 n=2 Tax=Cereibacter azotoformans TaxID=43057 RepID=A0A2T5JPZ3_9RHOB|nr:type I-U CRISPR-associated helicase/endonuclease Cas3 [Cereibacter azotoformans]MBO4170777.1 type I-U CRISPR-associated helicase/endonuclease Cas3 [Cereibacter azotoformans]PTR09905.1 CRISPR-associated endonuclease/helicase Cas3 [Cereibacter azotoformans]UIJ33314.1 type I-U CRISPR-associated helicase/endonuclease Cas3 [Cereibacter azotoformans]
MCDFARRFAALTTREGRPAFSPFPWQERLHARLAAGEIPTTVDLPTGLGKTSVIACWLLAHASHPTFLNPALPRRLVYVVDRRAVVDQASEEVARFTGTWKAAAGPAAPDITIATLRGQHIDSGEWARHPAKLSVIVGTVDMIGSRLLFSGYGVSPRMRPVHAGLLGLDTLLVLDEAHLAPVFADVVRTVAADPGLRGELAPPVAPFRMMALSATQRPHDAATAPFRLDEADHAHPVIAQRLAAEKTLERREGASPEDLGAAAEDLVSLGHRIVIFVDSRQTAEKVARLLAKRHGDDAVLLFTGARRGWERTRAEQQLREAGFLADSEPPAAPRFLVATAAGEVGVDLDADHAVMDLVSWERMVQRLGRVNRRGNGKARVIVCDAGQEEIRGASLSDCRALLDRLGDAGPAALAALAAEEPDLAERASSGRPLRPALVRAELDAWSLTGLREHPGRAPVAPFLRGWVEDEVQLRLVWRHHLPVRADNSQSLSECTAFFETAPVHLSEVLEAEIGQVSDWLKKRIRMRHDALEQDPPATAVGLVLDQDSQVVRVVTLPELRTILNGPKLQFDRFLGSLVGGTLVLDARFGGLSPWGLLDAGEDVPAVTADGGNAPTDWAAVIGFSVDRETDPAETEHGSRRPERMRFPLGAEEDNAPALVVRGPAREADETRADARSRGRPVLLHNHLEHVRTEVAALSQALGLPERAGAILDHAARLHDVGKAALLWQQAMHAPAGGPWAKTRSGDGRALAGYRHEFGSLLAAEEDPELAPLAAEDRDLVLHLIATHHGWARPFIPAHGGDRGPPSLNETVAHAAALRFARLQRRWGPWGLAWWEAVFRAADWAASVREEEDRADG